MSSYIIVNEVHPLKQPCQHVVLKANVANVELKTLNCATSYHRTSSRWAICQCSLGFELYVHPWNAFNSQMILSSPNQFCIWMSSLLSATTSASICVKYIRHKMHDSRFKFSMRHKYTCHVPACSSEPGKLNSQIYIIYCAQ